jgi:NitT/TauT family transport system substrate-binding protein
MVNIFPIAKLLMVIFMFILAGCDGNPPTTMRIGTNYWLGYEPLYLARELVT